MDRNRFIQCMKSNIELSDKERRRIIRRSVESQPWKLKCTIAMEEFAELTQAISKQIRGYDNRIGLLERWRMLIFAWNSLSPFLILHQKSCRRLLMLNYKEKGTNRDE